MAIMWAAVLAAGLDILTRVIIASRFGVSGAGIYHASWALSGMFANFVLSAMGTDFYPRLTSIIHDHAQATRAVNEQTEIGVLLALPGVLAALSFAPFAITLLYTKEFLAAADLLPWMVLGVFGRVISWPLGYVPLALGAARWYVVMETILFGLWAALTYTMVEEHGIIGAAYAFALIYSAYVVGMLAVTRILIGFSWSIATSRLVFAAAAFIGSAFATRFLWSDAATLIANCTLTFSAVVFSVRGLAARLGDEHRIVTWMLAAPGGRFLLSGALARVRD
jgi:PST family polysaccharide transporter